MILSVILYSTLKKDNNLLSVAYAPSSYRSENSGFHEEFIGLFIFYFTIFINNKFFEGFSNNSIFR